MLTHPTLERLAELKLTGMLKAYQEQGESAQSDALTFDERFGLLVDREHTERYNRSLAARLRKARLRLPATLEDVDYRQPRGLDKRLLLALAPGDWIRHRHNCIITGPTGAGKTYLACALGHQACREGCTVRYHRIPRLFQERALAKGDLLILDDWTTALLTDEQRRDLFEIAEDRYGRRSTLIAAQLPINHWHELIGDPTLADAILDRLIHNAHKIELKGDSMRKKKNSLNQTLEAD